MNVWSLLERAFGWGGVLAYHGVGDAPHLPAMHISPERLRAQLTHLRDQYNVVSLRELSARWRDGRSTEGCVAITFDDAYRGVATHALPILRALDLQATVFVASDHASRGGVYWWDDVELQRLALGNASWSEAPAAVGLPALDPGDETASDRIRTRVLSRFAGRWPKGVRAGGDTMWRSLTFDELAAMATDDRIDFAVHTKSHPALPLLSFDEQVAEIRDNLRVIQERLPRVLPIVAYPYGLYDRVTVRAALQAGMVAGVTMEGRASANHPNPMTVPRVGGVENRSAESVARRLTRALRPVLTLRNRGVHPKLPVDREADARSVSNKS